MNRLFDFSGSSMACVFGVPLYGAAGRRWWHKAFIRPLYRVGNRVHRLVWRLRYRVCREHRYHVIDTGLRPGYHDIDVLMLHGMFVLLERYVDRAMGGIERLEAFSRDLRQKPDPNAPQEVIAEQASAQEEAAFLYRWWKELRPSMNKRRAELRQALYGNRRRMRFEKGEGTGSVRIVIDPSAEGEEAKEEELRELEERIWTEENEMLERLVAIRRSLPT